MTVGATHHALLIFNFFVETESSYIAQAGLKLLASINPRTSASLKHWNYRHEPLGLAPFQSCSFLVTAPKHLNSQQSLQQNAASSSVTAASDPTAFSFDISPSPLAGGKEKDMLFLSLPKLFPQHPSKELLWAYHSQKSSHEEIKKTSSVFPTQQRTARAQVG
ncbi:Zinc finger protein, partial [Plecturocebus cupreus]